MQHGEIHELGHDCMQTTSVHHHVEDYCRMCGCLGPLQELVEAATELLEAVKENPLGAVQFELEAERLAVALGQPASEPSECNACELCHQCPAKCHHRPNLIQCENCGEYRDRRPTSRLDPLV